MPKWLAPTSIFLIGALMVYGLFGYTTNFTPGFGDEMNYLMQAKIFASGHLSVPQPELAQPFFYVDWMYLFSPDGSMWNFHPFGNSLVLALGQLVNLPYLTVPIVAGLVLVVQFSLAQALFRDQRVAWVHVGLLLTSHYFLSLAASYMAHTTSLLWLSLLCLSAVKIVRQPAKSQHQFALLGLWFGLAFLTRPVSALLVSAVPGLAVLCVGVKHRQWSGLLLSGLVGIGVASLIFWFTFLVAGQFTLPYYIKGLEVGQTIAARWARGWDFRWANVYRYLNEFSHRAHSGGIVWNMIFFWVPIWAVWQRKTRQRERTIVLMAYLMFFGFVLLHSFLQFYGWKWEPRMIYEVAFVFYLLSAYGLVYFWRQLAVTRGARIALGSLTLLAAFYVISIDLPRRFSTEYKDYNQAHPEIGQQIQEQKISHAIVLFPSDVRYAPYAPSNTLAFDGDIVYGVTRGGNIDQQLLQEYRGRSLFEVTSDLNVQPAYNLFAKDIFILEKLANNYLANKRQLRVIVPWTSLDGLKLQAASGEIWSESRLLEWLGGASDKTVLPDLVLVGTSRRLLPILARAAPAHLSSELSTLQTEAVLFQPRGTMTRPTGFASLDLSCFDNANWEGLPNRHFFVHDFDVSHCPGPNRSMIWTAKLVFAQAHTLELWGEADDGLTVVWQDQTLEPTVDSKYAAEKRYAIGEVRPGTYTLQVRYFNGPGAGFLKLKMQLDGQTTLITADLLEPQIWTELTP